MPHMRARQCMPLPLTATPPCCPVAEWAQNLLEQMGPRFAGPIAIIRNWTYCLFYVMAELWGSVVVSVLFWGFANQVRSPGMGRQEWWGRQCKREWQSECCVAYSLPCMGQALYRLLAAPPPAPSSCPCPTSIPLQITTVDEAKQFYPLFGLGANVALIFSGRAVKIFSQVRKRPARTALLQSRFSTLLCLHVPTALRCALGASTVQHLPLNAPSLAPQPGADPRQPARRR